MYSYKDIQAFAYKYSPEGIIIDTEVLTLFLLGKYDAGLIEKNPLTKERFFKSDIKILDNILGIFKKIIVTPFIVAEVSNLSRRDIKDPHLRGYFQSMVGLLEKVGETQIPLNDLLKIDISLVSKFGFTDMAMYKISEEAKTPIVTVDFPFYSYSEGKIPIINFTNIRAREGER